MSNQTIVQPVVYSISDHYNDLVKCVDDRQAKILSSQDIRQKVYWQSEVDEFQKEMKSIMHTMVDKGDLEYLPWVKHKTEIPIIKVQR